MPPPSCIHEPIRKLERLLCAIFTGNVNADEIPEDVAHMIQEILRCDDTPHWSIESFIWELHQACYTEGIIKTDSSSPRPSHDIGPKLHRSNVEAIGVVTLIHDPANDEAWNFAIRCLDQVYGMVRTAANEKYKPFIQVLAEQDILHGYPLLSQAMDVTTQGDADGSDTTNGNIDKRGEHYGGPVEERKDQDVPDDEAILKETPGVGVADILGGKDVFNRIRARLVFLDDRAKIFEKRGSLLQTELISVSKTMVMLRLTNKKLARKVSELQQRFQDRTRTFKA